MPDKDGRLGRVLVGVGADEKPMWALAGLYRVYYAIGRMTGDFHSIADFFVSWKYHWIPFFLIPRAMSAVAGTSG